MFGIATMAVQFRLGKLLEDAQISQSDLARKAGVTFATVNAIANNRTRQVHLDTIDKLCKALGVAPGDLFEQKRGGR